MIDARPAEAGRPPQVVARVRVEPKGFVVEVRPGESLLAAAERRAFQWPTVCHGQADCTACYIEILEGADAFGDIEALEREALERLPERRIRPEGAFRLACQVTPVGDAVVRKRGVRAAPGSGDLG